jgi:hypothetical protein
MQINSINNNNSKPKFGMAAKFKTQFMSRKALDICTMAAKTIKKEAKGVDINVHKLEWSSDGDFYITVGATTARNFFQRLFQKDVEMFNSTSMIEAKNSPESIEEYAKILQEEAIKVKKKYFDESIEVGKKNLKNAMKEERRMTYSNGPESATHAKKSCCEIDVP